MIDVAAAESANGGMINGFLAGGGASVLVALLLYLGDRAYKVATTRKTDAETDRTGAETEESATRTNRMREEGWKDLLTGVQSDNEDLRESVSSLREDLKVVRQERDELKQRVAELERLVQDLTHRMENQESHQ